ncbi:MAG: hypothetical protein Q8O26_08800 [Phreatobacter sp.]|uniref:hypothetical protein n=1 Tax=Phreatobacter sp. TaxID=1966341 RepID=UPI002734E8A1|nr:hypothetical protein [Phreatobacter sp.]MDP2801966.1 hypothetical protein [Phreatobacter sp.]
MATSGATPGIHPETADIPEFCIATAIIRLLLRRTPDKSPHTPLFHDDLMQQSRVLYHTFRRLFCACEVKSSPA